MKTQECDFPNTHDSQGPISTAGRAVTSTQGDDLSPVLCPHGMAHSGVSQSAVNRVVQNPLLISIWKPSLSAETTSTPTAVSPAPAQGQAHSGGLME